MALENLRTVDFMGKRRIAGTISILLVLLAMGSLAIKQLNFGLDFTGGTLVELGFADTAPLAEIREVLEDNGYPQAVVVTFGTDTDVLVRVPESESAQLGDNIVNLLRQELGAQIELRRVEYVGPQVGEQLREQGGLAMLLALAVVMVYIAFRFQFKFAVGAVVALIHDVLLVLGCFSFFGWDFDLTVLAAVLAVIGYSLNDTIVVSDRIRENFRKLRKMEPAEMINVSLTETLARTLVTSLTTLLVLIALFVFGGEMIHSFAIALIIGVVVGTYSSIYVAANVLLTMKLDREDLMLPEKEGVEADGMP